MRRGGLRGAPSLVRGQHGGRHIARDVDAVEARGVEAVDGRVHLRGRRLQRGEGGERGRRGAW